MSLIDCCLTIVLVLLLRLPKFFLKRIRDRLLASLLVAALLLTLSFLFKPEASRLIAFALGPVMVMTLYDRIGREIKQPK